MSMTDDLRSYLLTPPTSGDMSARALALLVVQNMTGGTRIYPDYLDEMSPLPAVVYKLIDDPQDHLLSGENIGLLKPRIQIDVYTLGKLDRDSLSNAISTALDGFTGPMGSTPVNLLTYNDAHTAFGAERRQFIKMIDFKVNYADT